MKFLLGFLTACLLWVLFLSMIPMPDEQIKVYDCTLAEIHPDFPPDVREECRKKIRENLAKGNRWL